MSTDNSNRNFFNFRPLSYEDLAALFGCSVESLYTRFSKNPETLPPPLDIKGMRRKYWHPDTVRDWLETRKPCVAPNISHANESPTHTPSPDKKRRGRPPKNGQLTKLHMKKKGGSNG